MRWLSCLIALTLTCFCYNTVSSGFVSSKYPLECGKGPSYWCFNITTAKKCGAVKHCIQTVWEHLNVPDDNDDVCTICKDMVAQARDQLKSNETQEELKEVFEGSCKLIPVKVVTKECITLVDDFIPELVETLASQMNPSVVCSVAGLCNNAHVDKLLSQEGIVATTDTQKKQKKDCDNCYVAANEINAKFQATPMDTMRNNFLQECRNMGSYSDACSSLVLQYFPEVYNHLKNNLNADNLCHLASMCVYRFHNHYMDELDVIHESEVGYIRQVDDDVPCDFCQQLVVHVKDILVANTTEEEFRTMLLGICKQTGTFKDECRTIIEEYYSAVYDFLVNSLNPEEFCKMIGICPSPSTGDKGPMWPLLPPHTAELAKQSIQENSKKVIISTKTTPAQRLIGVDEANSYPPLVRVQLHKDESGVRVQTENSAQLPVERMFPESLTFVANNEVCTFCEYFLHYLQTALTTPSTEKIIRDAVDNACHHLPSVMVDQCQSFVETYGDALVALLAQEIDPSQVCPALRLCPQEQVMIDLVHSVKDKSTCPLCLFAVEELVSKLKDNKTEDEIKQALDNLCDDLPKSLVADCRYFVQTYSEELVDMVIADFTPQEICVYLHLCDESASVKTELFTNEIPMSAAEKISVIGDSNECVLCEFVMSKLDEILKENSTEEEIKTLVHDVCNFLPRTVRNSCNDFVNKYADLVITLLAESIDPKVICTEIKLCSKIKVEIEDTIEDCAVCNAATTSFITEMKNSHDDAKVVLKKLCNSVPKKYFTKCQTIVKSYGPSFVNLLSRNDNAEDMCVKTALCPKQLHSVKLIGAKKCTWGPAYWCKSLENANSCGTTVHCQEKVWMGAKPPAN